MSKISVLKKRNSKNSSSDSVYIEKHEKVIKEILQNFELSLVRITPNGKLLYCNSSFISLLGYSSINQIKSINLAGIYKNPLAIEEIVRSLDKNESIIRQIVTLFTKEGKEIIALLSAIARKNKRGKIIYIDIFIEKDDIHDKERRRVYIINKSFRASINLKYLLDKPSNFNTILQKYIKSIPDNLFNNVESAVYLYNDGWLLPETFHVLNHTEYFLPVQVNDKNEETSIIIETFRSEKEIVVNNTQKPDFFQRYPIYKNRSILSFVALPLIYNSICMGVLFVISNKLNFFSKDKMKYFHKLTVQISSYVYKTFGSYKSKVLQSRGLNKARALHDGSNSLMIPIDIDKIVEDCFSILKENNFDSAKLYFIEERGNYLELLSFFLNVDSMPLKKIAKTTLFSGRAATEKKSVIVNNSHSKEVVKIDPGLKDKPRHSFAAIPLIFKDKVLGVLTISSRRYNQFNSTMILYCEILSQQLALALNSTIQYLETQKDSKCSLQLNNIINRLSKHISLNYILNEVIEVFKEMGFIYINVYETSYDSNGNEDIKLISNYSVFEQDIFSKSNIFSVLIEETIKSSTPIIIKDTHSVQFLNKYTEYENYEKHTLTLFPIKCNEGKMYVAVLAHRIEEVFNSEKINFLLDIFKQLALLINNAHSYNENIIKLSSNVSIIDITREYFNFFIIKNAVDSKVFLLNDKKLSLFDSYHNNDSIPNYPDSIYKGFLLLINDSNKPVIFNSSHSPKLKKLWKDVTSYNEHSIGIFPIKYSDKIQGLFILAFDNPNCFDESKIELIEDIVHYFGLLLSNLQSYEYELNKSRHLNLINELSFELNQETDIVNCCKIITEKISKIFDFDGFYLDMYDEKKDTLYNVMGIDIVDGEKVYLVGDKDVKVKGLIKDIIQTQKPVLLLREHENDKIYGMSTYGDESRRSLSLMYTPLLHEGKVLGIMNFNSYKKHAFSQEDFNLFVWIANQLSVIIKNIVLYKNLSDSENRYKALFHNSPEAVFSCDRNGIILTANPETLKLLKVNQEDDIIGKPLVDFLPSKLEEVYSHYYSTLFNDGTKKVFELTGDDNNYYEVALMPTFEGTQETDYTVCIVRDITSMKEAEKTTQRIHQQELENKKNDFIVNITKNIAHVFNNIFVNVSSRASFVKTMVKEGEPIYSHLDKIEFSTKKVNELVRQLLLFAQGGYYVPESVDLNKSVQFFYLSKKPQIPKEIDFQLKLMETAPIVRSNNDQLILMLDKLITNSVEAFANNNSTDKKIVIKIGTVTMNEQKMFGKQEVEKGNYGFFTVVDNGCGIKDGVISKLYEPFNTTKEYGRGLGLASVYGMVMNMNGFITINTKLGESTKIRVWLPLVK
jgi:PAS domain S-box-containing protein